MVGRLRHTARGAAGRRAERDPQARLQGLADDRLGGQGLTDAGAAGDDADPGGKGAEHRRPLFRRQSLRMLLVGGRGFVRLVIELARRRDPPHQRLRHRDLRFERALAVGVVPDHHQSRRFDQHLGVGDDSEQPGRPPRQLLQRQVGAAALLGFGEDEEGGRLRPPR